MTKKTKIDAPLLNVLLGKSTAPKIKEVSGSDWIIYGDNEYKNLYPQFLIDEIVLFSYLSNALL